MKKSILILFFLVFSINSFAIHKDRIFQGNYGNVKTLVKTGFDNYGSTERLDILGKLTQKLSKKLAFKHTIIIEFRHDYLKLYPKFTIVENCESTSIYFLNKDLETLNKTQKTLQDKVSKNAIAIRILDTDINIENVLKLVEYAILNRIEIVKNNEEYIDADYPNSINKFSYLGLKKEIVNEINNSNTSETILKLLKEKTFFIKTDNISAYYLNNSYYFSNKLISFSTNSLEYLIKNNNNYYVFTSKKDFIFFSSSSKEKIIHSLNFEGNFPFHISNYNYISKEKVKNGVYISFHRSSNAFTFSEDKNEIISYFKN